jgi:hypothetical protein
MGRRWGFVVWVCPMGHRWGSVRWAAAGGLWWGSVHWVPTGGLSDGPQLGVCLMGHRWGFVLWAVGGGLSNGLQLGGLLITQGGGSFDGPLGGGIVESTQQCIADVSVLALLGQGGTVLLLPTPAGATLEMKSSLLVPQVKSNTNLVQVLTTKASTPTTVQVLLQQINSWSGDVCML